MKARLKKIKMVLTDVDGVLTDTRIFLSDSGQWRRFFSIRDGLGLIRLQEAGYEVGIITTSKADDIRERAKNLGIKWFYEGIKDKIIAFEEIVKKSGIRPEEIAYIGDDYPDLEVLKKVGFSATVPESFTDIKAAVDYTTKRPGGVGAVREVCELVLKFGAFAKK